MYNFQRISKIIGALGVVAAVIGVFIAIADHLGLDMIRFGQPVPYYNGMYTVDGYVSNFLGYKFTTPSGCKLYNMEERAEASEIPVAGLSDAQIAEKFAESNEVIDLFATMPSGVTVLVDANMSSGLAEKNLEIATEILIRNISEEGFKLVGDLENAQFLGKDCIKFYTTVTMQGLELEQEYYALAIDGCAYFFSFIYDEEDEEMVADKEKLINAFSPYLIE